MGELHKPHLLGTIAKEFEAHARLWRLPLNLVEEDSVRFHYGGDVREALSLSLKGQARIPGYPEYALPVPWAAKPQRSSTALILSH